jgi:cytidylate kinase
MTDAERKALAETYAYRMFKQVAAQRDAALTEAATLRSENAQLRMWIDRFVRIWHEEEEYISMGTRLSVEALDARKTLDWLK